MSRGTDESHLAGLDHSLLKLGIDPYTCDHRDVSEFIQTVKADDRVKIYASMTDTLFI